MSTTLLFLSYFGPEDTSSGIRAGKLALAARRAGYAVHFLHGGDANVRGGWRDGISTSTFRRTDPSAARDRRRRSLADLAAAPQRGGVARPLVAAAKRAARLLLQPDEMVLSQRSFARAATDETRRLRAAGERVVLVAVCPVWSTALVGRRVKRATGAPLILELDDLWSANGAARWPKPLRALNRALERRAMRAADGVIYVNEAIGERFAAAHPALARIPAAVAHIGFEREPAERMRVGPAPALSLVYVGTVYGDRDMTGLLDACRIARSRGVAAIVHWYGALLGDHPLRAVIPGHVAAGTLVVHSPVPHDVALERMAAADLLVTIPSPSYPEELTGKLFDYLDARRPVLGLAAGDSLLAAFLRENRAGACLASHDAQAIADFLVRCARDGVSFSPDRALLERYRLPALGAATRGVVERLTWEAA